MPDASDPPRGGRLPAAPGSTDPHGYRPARTGAHRRRARAGTGGRWRRATGATVLVTSLLAGGAVALARATPAGTATAGPAQCRAGDLDPRPGYEYGGAAGHQYQTVVVRNDASEPCLLLGHPALLYTDARDGTEARIPDLDDTGEADPVVVPPGGYARFTIAEANGVVLAMPDPDCVARDYHGVSVLVAGDRYPLAALRLAWFCRTGVVGSWYASTQPPDPAD